MWVITVFLEDRTTTMYEFETEEEAKDTLKNTKGIKILSEIVYFYPFPTEDLHFKECEGHSPMSKWEMNVGWQ